VKELLLSLAALWGVGQDAPPVPPEGLASLYPGDAGLERDPRVLFVESFERDPKSVGWMQPDGWFADVKFADRRGDVLHRTVEEAVDQGGQSS